MFQQTTCLQHKGGMAWVGYDILNLGQMHFPKTLEELAINYLIHNEIKKFDHDQLQVFYI